MGETYLAQARRTVLSRNWLLADLVVAEKLTRCRRPDCNPRYLPHQEPGRPGATGPQEYGRLMYRLFHHPDMGTINSTRPAVPENCYQIINSASFWFVFWTGGTTVFITSIHSPVAFWQKWTGARLHHSLDVCINPQMNGDYRR